MSWLIGNLHSLGPTAAKMALLILSAVAGYRLSERRTLARLRPFDVVAFTAVGAVIGRAATSSNTSYLQGLTALLVIFAVHQLLSRSRFIPVLRKLTEHRLRILIRDGRVIPSQLWWCGLTRSDIDSALRERGVYDSGEVGLLLYEAEGAFTVVGRDGSGNLIQDAIQQATGQPKMRPARND